MDGKPEALTNEALRAILLRLAVAHNRAVLAGMTIALGVGLGLIALGAGAFGAPGPRSLAVRLLGLPIAAAGIVIGWRGVRLHRRTIRDLGAGRAAAAALAAEILARGGSAPAAALESTLGREAVERGLEQLARLDVGWTEPGATGGAGGPLVAVDGARLRALLDSPAGGG